MHERRLVPHNGDMALPEQKVASPQLLELVRVRKRAAQRLLLHVAVARARDATGGERKLQQPRAVDAETGLSSPQIGCSQKPLRDGDEISFHCLDGCQMETGT